MIKIKESGKKQWTVKDEETEKFIIVDLISSSVTNKFSIVVDFVERLIEHDAEFGPWFFKWLEDCQSKNPTLKSRAYRELDTIKAFVDKYLDSLELDLGAFVDESKAKKNSIFFTIKDIDSILRLSSYLKVYSFILNALPSKIDEKTKKETISLYPGNTMHREIYNNLARKVISSDVTSKIFDVIKTRTFKYNMSVKFM